MQLAFPTLEFVYAEEAASFGFLITLVLLESAPPHTEKKKNKVDDSVSPGPNSLGRNFIDGMNTVQ